MVYSPPSRTEPNRFRSARPSLNVPTPEATAPRPAVRYSGQPFQGKGRRACRRSTETRIRRVRRLRFLHHPRLPRAQGQAGPHRAPALSVRRTEVPRQSERRPQGGQGVHPDRGRAQARRPARPAPARQGLRRLDRTHGRNPVGEAHRLSARQDVPRPQRRLRGRPARQLQFHHAGPGAARDRQQRRTQSGRGRQPRPGRPARLVRRLVGGRRADGGRESRGAERIGPALRRPGAGLRLLPDAVPRVRRFSQRRTGRRDRPDQAGAARYRHLEGTVRLPARRSESRDQQAPRPQRLRAGRQRRARQDVHRAGRRQVFRVEERARADPVSQEAAPQLDPLPRQQFPQPVRRGPLPLRGAVAYRPVARERTGGRRRSRQPDLGELRPAGHRRIPQLPQQRPGASDAGRKTPADALRKTRDRHHRPGRADQGPAGVGHAGQQRIVRPAQPDLLHRRRRRDAGRGRGPCLRRESRRSLRQGNDPHRAGGIHALGAPTAAGPKEPRLGEGHRRRLLQAARRVEHRALPPADSALLSGRNGRAGRLPRPAAAALHPLAH